LNYPEVTRILVDEEEVRRTVARLAGEINASYRDLQRNSWSLGCCAARLSLWLIWFGRSNCRWWLIS
jgi:hypothetical protein